MRLTVEKEKLLKMLARVQGIADKKSSMAILSTVLLETTENGIELSATDLEIGFKGYIEAEIKEQGSLAIPARKFYEIVKEFPLETIYLEEKEAQWLTIYGDNEELVFRLAALPAEDFPALPDIEGIKLVDVPGGVLAEMISKTIFCVATEENRFLLSGIFIEKIPEEENILRFVATDGHRLALIDRNIDNIKELELSPGVIVPKKAAQEIKKMAQDHVLIKFGLKENHIIVASTTEVITTRLIDGQYPDYRAVIPENKEKIVIVPRKNFIEALKRVSIISSERYRPVKLEFGENYISIVSSHPDLGEGREKIKCSYSGDPFSLNFNAKYLIDILDVMESEDVELCLNNENTPCIISGINDLGFLGLVMPMTTV